MMVLLTIYRRGLQYNYKQTDSCLEIITVKAKRHLNQILQKMSSNVSYVGVSFIAKDGTPVLFHTVGGDEDAETPFDFQLAYWRGMDQLDEAVGGQHKPIDAFLGLLSPVLAESGEHSTNYNINSSQTKGTKSKGTHDFQAIRA